MFSGVQFMVRHMIMMQHVYELSRMGGLTGR